MITVNEYIKKHNIRKADLIKERIKENKLHYSKVENKEYYIDNEIYKIDFRRMPKKATSVAVKATIIQAINEFFHVDHKMLGIKQSHFKEYLKMLSELEVIRLVSGKDAIRIESYIIGKVIPNEIINNRTKLLNYIDKKLDLVLETATTTVVQKIL